MGVKLSVQAELDIIDLIARGIELFGPEQSDKYFQQLKSTFARIAQFPLANRERGEIDPPLRIQVYQSHLIIYRTEPDGVFIIRVVHGHYDWHSEL